MNRRIVGWSMSERIKANLVCHALKSACWQHKPSPGLILNTDRGCQLGFKEDTAITMARERAG